MDGTVRVWDLRTGDCRHRLTGHTSLVGLLGLSPSHLVSAAADSTLRIWDPDTGELQHTLAAHTGAITCFQHDEFKVLSGSDGNLKMWNIRDGTVVRDLLTGITGVWQVVFEGRWCVAASNRQDTTVLDVWDFGTENDEDWVGEPPNGIYDDEDFEEDDDEEDEGAAKIKTLMEFQEEEDDEQEQADVDAMDQDLVPSETESLEIVEMASNHSQEDSVIPRRNTGKRVEPVDGDIEIDDDSRGSGSGGAGGVDSDTDTMSQPDSRWEPAHTRASSPSQPARSRVARTAAAPGPSRRAYLGGLSSANSLPPFQDDTPTRPRIRGLNSRRQR